LVDLQSTLVGHEKAYLSQRRGEYLRMSCP
jgi:hypothetical protein